jgi:UDP-3-O-[3-hydroxymyristoyl] glucosamine N-acyltransferase
LALVGFTVATLCAQLGLPVPAAGGELTLTGIKTLAEAGPAELAFLENPSYRSAAQTTKAGAVLVRAAEVALLPASAIPIICPQPYVAYAKALHLYHPVKPLVPGISQFAVVSGRATIHPTARIEPYAVIYADVVVGEGTHIMAHAVLGEGVIVGAQTRIGSHVSLTKCRIGNECIIHPGVRIGQDGFGFAQQGEELVKIPHLGHVSIGNRVEIGANSTIDAGALSDTVIEDDVKLDKQVQIAHNVRLGRGVRIAAQSGIAGSTHIGPWCVIGGQVGIAGHLTIAPKCMVAALSGVTKNIETPGSVVAGVPAVPITQWRQQMASLAFAAKRANQAANKPNPPAKAEAPTPARAQTKPQQLKTPLPIGLAGPDSANPFVAEEFS